MKSNLLLAGYLGCGNFGDDAILLGFLEGISDYGYNFSVLASQPEKLMRTYGLSSVARFDASQVKNAIAECDALVFPGGSVFQDVSSVRSIIYYAGLVKTAKKAGKKVIMLGQGVGPINTFFGKKFARKAFDSADVLMVRDPQSVQTIRSLGCQVTPRVAADMAFLLPDPAKDGAPAFSAGGMKTVGISIRPYGKLTNQIVDTFSDLSQMLFKAGWMPVLMGLDENEDFALMEKISKKNGGKVPDLKGVGGPVPLQQRISRMDAVIAMRLHAGILAATVGVPPYMVSYDPKVNAFANSLGLATPPSIEGLTAQRLFDGFTTFVKDRDRIADSLVRRREDLRSQAQENIKALHAALG